jgi:hypothetical protein
LCAAGFNFPAGSEFRLLMDKTTSIFNDLVRTTRGKSIQFKDELVTAPEANNRLFAGIVETQKYVLT